MNLIIGLFFVSIFTFPLFAKPTVLTQQEINMLEKRQSKEQILYEMYLTTDKGLASVFGYHFDTFFLPKWYYSIAIFGAVNGERGGYGIASFGGGYYHPITERLAVDTKFLTGSGGGGGLKAGGGFAIEVLSGVSYNVYKKMYLTANYGYLTFPTGEFDTPIINFGLTMRKDRLTLPYK